MALILLRGCLPLAPIEDERCERGCANRMLPPGHLHPEVWFDHHMGCDAGSIPASSYILRRIE